jgi:hypothetical protein
VCQLIISKQALDNEGSLWSLMLYASVSKQVGSVNCGVSSVFPDCVDFERVTEGNIDAQIVTKFSVGIDTVLVVTDGGAVYQWELAQNLQSSEFQTNLRSPTRTQLQASGNGVSAIMSHWHQVVAVVPPDAVIVDPVFVDSTNDQCGTTSFNCPTLSMALTRYTMQGTTFSVNGNFSDNLIPLASSDVVITGSGRESTVIDCAMQQCILLSGDFARIVSQSPLLFCLV